MDNDTLDHDEKWIVLAAIKCLHNLKYISDLAIIGQKNSDLLEQLIEEVVKIREALHGRNS
jgi:hypothetical protein